MGRFDLAHLPENSPKDAQSLLVIGGTSDIGRACALLFAEAGFTILLAGRDKESLTREAGDIAARSGADVSVHPLDILETETFEDFIKNLPILPDLVLSVVGLLGDQTKAETDLLHARTIIRSNFEGPALLLGLFAEKFAARDQGVIVGVSSVAGDRGRANNYVYGAGKAGFSAFLSGLRNRFGKTGVHVLTVKPGFVRTRMTAGMPLPGPLTAEPVEVAKAIYRAAVVHPRNVIYVKPVWYLVMTIITLIPESIFKRLRI